LRRAREYGLLNFELELLGLLCARPSTLLQFSNQPPAVRCRILEHPGDFCSTQPAGEIGLMFQIDEAAAVKLTY